MAQTMLGAVNQLKEASDTLTANDTTLNTGAAALTVQPNLEQRTDNPGIRRIRLSDGVTQLAQGSASLTQGTETLKKDLTP